MNGEAPNAPASSGTGGAGRGSPLRSRLERWREGLVRASHVAKAKVAAALTRRERDRLFSELGEAVYVAWQEQRVSLPEGERAIAERISGLSQKLERELAEIDSAMAAAFRG